MSKQNFYATLQSEINRVDTAAISKRHERVISSFRPDGSRKAVIQNQEYLVFNSNDYLGLRFDPRLAESEHSATLRFGASPGAVRFISGTLEIYQQLEQRLAEFHGREAAMVTSSAFAANVGVLHALIKGQSKDAVINSEVLVLSDALNHRSIIDGIRVANLPSEQRKAYAHLDVAEVRSLLVQNQNGYKRVLIITDGIFSMLGECAPLDQLRALADEFDEKYEHGVQLVVDDSHGVGVFGKHGRGCEEVCSAQADVLIGTMGKAFGADGGYVVANQVVIDYLRESTATYIYSNSISPGVAGAALQAVEIAASEDGDRLRKKLQSLINYIKQQVTKTKYTFAKNSDHAIQPLLVGNPDETKQLTKHLFNAGCLITPINYPIVPKGQDEIRIQLSALHSQEDVDVLISALSSFSKI